MHDKMALEVRIGCGWVLAKRRHPHPHPQDGWEKGFPRLWRHGCFYSCDWVSEFSMLSNRHTKDWTKFLLKSIDSGYLERIVDQPEYSHPNRINSILERDTMPLWHLYDVHLFRSLILGHSPFNKIVWRRNLIPIRKTIWLIKITFIRSSRACSMSNRCEARLVRPWTA